jgi:VanZ family protein
MAWTGWFCVGFACLDEYRQTFVPGRDGNIRDVLIDSMGIFAGILFVKVFLWMRRKKICMRDSCNK